ncbi:SLC13 family permease [Plantibacter sp. YIM 135249]|uniref:SLC13 family permease n=1 Tax=Plantibacter sp. YIM 135249 TaxID=3423918 RepID=UPI003D343788
MRTAILGGVLLVIGAVTVATGVLPADEAIGIAQRVWPILLFVVVITVVTELAAEAGLFALIAEQTASWGRGRTWVLWLLVLGFAVVSTVFLSLDTTAVLLTPVVVLLARHVGVSPIPFALTTVWMANTASLLLPVSNLTNLLAQHALDGPSPAEFAGLMAAPAVVAVIVPAAILFVVFRKELVGRYALRQAQGPGGGVQGPAGGGHGPEVGSGAQSTDGGSPSQGGDRVLLVASAIVVVCLLPLLVSGLEVWIPALGGAVVLGIVFLVRRPSALRFGLLPWQLVLLASGLFLVVEAAHSLGLGTLLTTISGTGNDLPSLLQLAGVGALSANAIDNLPAYLALEPVAGDPLRFAALLIGVNAGPLITPWASLATLLWHARLHSLNVRFGWGRYILLGLLAAPLTVVLATTALWLAHR